MNKSLLENIIKAAQTANLLTGDLREAHKNAEDPALETTLLEMIEKSSVTEQRLSYLSKRYQEIGEAAQLTSAATSA